MTRDQRIIATVISAIAGLVVCSAIIYWTHWNRGWVTLLLAVWAGLTYYVFWVWLKN